MKKLLFCLVLLAAVLAPLAASAEYLTYYDILNDAKTFVGKHFDSLWEKNPEEAKAGIEALYGYKCGDMEEDIITCSQSHWTGQYLITLHFTEDKLDYTDFKLTNDDLKVLNYKRGGTSQVYQADKFLERMEQGGFFHYVYEHYDTGFRMFYSVLPDEETIPSTPALQADDHSFIQLGYNVISPTNPEFNLEFIFASDTYTQEHGLANPPEN